MGSSGPLGAALLAALAAPRIWPSALAAFLVRGGIMVLLLPVLALPTPSGLANVVAPLLSGFAFGRLSLAMLLAVGLIGLGTAIWVIVGGWLGTRLDLALIEDAREAGAEETGFSVPSTDPAATASTTFLLRLIAHLPLVAALAVGSLRVVQAGYRELILPGDLTVPFALRVLSAVPEAIAAIVAAWLVGELVGGLAAREFALGGRSARGALAAAVGFVVRHPLTTLRLEVATRLVMVLAALPPLLAGNLAWNRLVITLANRPEQAILPLLTFVALWLGGLALVAGAVAWRQLAWTFAVGGLRTRASEE